MHTYVNILSAIQCTHIAIRTVQCKDYLAKLLIDSMRLAWLRLILVKGNIDSFACIIVPTRYLALIQFGQMRILVC